VPILDIVLLALLALALVAGFGRGFVASAGWLLGLVVGVVTATWLVPLVNDAWPWPQWRTLIVIVLFLLLVALGTAIGGAIGARARRGVDRGRLGGLDRFLGGVLSLIIGVLTLSLAGSTLVAVGSPPVAAAVSSSVVVRTIDRFTPPPVADALARLRSIVLDDGLPRLAELLPTTSAPSAPPVALDDPELATAAESVARVWGTAYACGVSTSGTGFVVAPGRIVTNAHVVAGVDTPVVQVPGDEAREGRVVYFDPIDDLAVLAVDELAAAPLPRGTTLAPGASAVVQGYPLGGPFRMVGAGVVSTGTAPVPDIYDASVAPREIYALAAEVLPGNSGGPLLTSDGVVAGVVFGRGEDGAGRGYALTMAELDPVADLAAGLSQPVSSGGCLG